MLHDARELSVTEAARQGVAGLVAAAEHGSDLVVTRHHRPVAVVVGIDRLTAAADTGRRTSLDDVLTAFGHTRESLSALPDDE
jgi:prevent-host-death family protein